MDIFRVVDSCYIQIFFCYLKFKIAKKKLSKVLVKDFYVPIVNSGSFCKKINIVY